LTGTWFGITPEALPAPLKNLRLDWLSGDTDTVGQHIMYICFVIGTIHLLIAHVWNFIRKINSWACLSDLGWVLSTCTMFFAVGTMVLSNPFPPVMLYVLGVGVALVIISVVLEREYFGLVTLVLDVIYNFVDIISYVRLYAVGAASFAIANAFNEMAVGALGEKGIFIGGLIAAVCIFFGHALNIVLGAMGILVHGIRLNTLEFSSHAGVQWGGFDFKPFSKRKEEV
jgi:V/A-type H+-transporting ATPase subunit I